MQEFIFGIILGVLAGRIKLPKKPIVKKDAEVQVSPPPVTSPILIQNSKPRYIPYLVNFWGGDSG
jgi:hypothetical protein